MPRDPARRSDRTNFEVTLARLTWMARSARVLVLGPRDDLAVLGSLRDFDGVIVAFWSSPDLVGELEGLGATCAWSLSEVLGETSEMTARRYRAARAWLDATSLRYRGVDPLEALETHISAALLVPMVAAKLGSFVRHRFGAGTTLVFVAPSDLSRSASRLEHEQAVPLSISDTPGDDGTRRQAGVSKRARGILGRVGTVANPLADVLEVIDLGYRARTPARWRRRRVGGGRWCFSSYAGFTRALASASTTPPMDETRWLVNTFSARRGLPEGADWQWLWRVPARIDRAAHRRVLAAARDALHLAPVSVEGLPLRALLPQLMETGTFTGRLLSHLLVEIDLLFGFVAAHRPDELWVANQWSSENLALQVARVAGVPTCQVQHGLLEEHFGVAPVYSDRLLVWDQSSLALLSPQGRARAELGGARTEPEGSRASAGSADSRGFGDPSRAVTVFTAAYGQFVLVNAEAMRRELVRLVAALVARGHAVRVRLHPSDSERAWRHAFGRWTSLSSESWAFDRRASSSRVLASTSVAVMAHHSTLILDCIRAQVPVVVLNWLPAPLEVESDLLHGHDSGAVRPVLSRSDAMAEIESALAAGRELGVRGRSETD